MLSQLEAGKSTWNIGGDIYDEFILDILMLIIVGIVVPIILTTPLFIFVPETHSFLYSVSCIAIDICELLYRLYILIYNVLLYPLHIIIHLPGYIYAALMRPGEASPSKKDCNTAHKDTIRALNTEDIASILVDGSGVIKITVIKNESPTQDEELPEIGCGKDVCSDNDALSDRDSAESAPAAEPEISEVDSSCFGNKIQDDSPSCLENNEGPVQADSGLGDSISSDPGQRSDSNEPDKDHQAIIPDNEHVDHDATENLSNELSSGEEIRLDGLETASIQAKQEVSSSSDQTHTSNTNETQDNRLKTVSNDTKPEVPPSIDQTHTVETLQKIDFARTKKDDFDFVVDKKGGILALHFSFGLIIFTFLRNAVSGTTRLRIAAGKERPDKDGKLWVVMPSIHIFKFSPSEPDSSIDPKYPHSPYKLMKFEKPILIEAQLPLDYGINEMELQITESSNRPNWMKVEGVEIKKNGDQISVEIDFFAGLRIVAKEKSLQMLYAVYLKRPTGITDPDKHFLTVLIYKQSKCISREAERTLAKYVNDVVIERRGFLVRTPCCLSGRVFVTAMQTSPDICLLKIDSDKTDILEEMSFVIKKTEQGPIDRNETFELRFELKSDGSHLRTATQEFYWNAPVLTRHISIGSIGSVENFIVNANGERSVGVVINSSDSVRRSESSFAIPDLAFSPIVGRSSEPSFNHYESESSSDDYDLTSDERMENLLPENMMPIEFIERLENLHLHLDSPLCITTPNHQSTPNQTSSANCATASTSRAEPKFPQPNFISETNFPMDK